MNMNILIKKSLRYDRISRRMKKLIIKQINVKDINSFFGGNTRKFVILWMDECYRNLAKDGSVTKINHHVILSQVQNKIDTYSYKSVIF